VRVVEDEGWFGDDGSIDPELSAVELAFVLGLRARAVAWPAEHCYSMLAPPRHGYPLVASLDIDEPDRNHVLLTVGVHFYGDTIRGDRLHNQLFTLPDEPTPLALHACGSAEELAERTADWFEAIMQLPIVRHEWRRSGEVYAHRYLFADSGQGLSEGRIRTRELGPPDQVIHIQGRVGRNVTWPPPVAGRADPSR
jgi:hypothetical protein